MIDHLQACMIAPKPHHHCRWFCTWRPLYLGMVLCESSFAFRKILPSTRPVTMESLFQVLDKSLDLSQTLDDPEYYLDPWIQLASRLSSSAIQGREYFQKDLSFGRGLFFFDRAVETPSAGLASSRLMMKPDSGLCFCYSSRGL